MDSSQLPLFNHVSHLCERTNYQLISSRSDFSSKCLPRESCYPGWSFENWKIVSHPCGRGLSRDVYETSANLVSTIGMHTDVVLTCDPAGGILCRRTLVQCSSHRTLPAQREGGVAPATICKPRN